MATTLVVYIQHRNIFYNRGTSRVYDQSLIVATDHGPLKCHDYQHGVLKYFGSMKS